MKVAVAGAGVGGLAVAAMLARRGHQVAVYDQFDQPRPVGSGLVIQPVGQAVLARLGCLDAARAMGAPIRRMLGREARSGRKVLDVWYDPGGQPANLGLAIHRAALFDVLHKAALAAGAQLIPNRVVTGAEGGRLMFANAQASEPADLVIDAAGAGSPLSPLRPKALGYGAIWGTVDWPEDTAMPRDVLAQRYVRASRMIGVMACGRVPGQRGPKATLFWSLPRDGFAAWQTAGIAAWRSETVSLWPELAPFLSQITDPGQMTMARYGHGTLRRPFGDGIAHIGDAAHCASPQLGQGANMALLDGAALARALDGAPVQAALDRYAAARRGHVLMYQMMSAAFTPMYQSRSRVLPVLRDRVLFPASQIPPVPRVLTRLVRGTLLPSGAGPDQPLP